MQSCKGEMTGFASGPSVPESTTPRKELRGEVHHLRQSQW